MSPGLGLGEGIVPEAVFRSPLNFLDVLHSSETFSFSLSGLEGPVVGSHFGSGVSTVSTPAFLDVVCFVTATSTFVVDLSVAFTEALSSFSFTHKSSL